MAKKGEYKSYRECSDCKIVLPLSRKYFRRITSLKVFDKTCKECRHTEGMLKHWKNGLLLCSHCKEYLLKEYFSINTKLCYRGRDKRCRKCKTLEATLLRNSREGESAIDRLVTERFLAARDRATKQKLEFSITKTDIREILEKQDGKCAISGVPLTFIMGRGRIPTNISIDKIDPKLGYTLDNCQLVCMAINQMKSDLSMDQLLYFCKRIIYKNEYTYKEKE